jgi:hypothetical protein
MRNNRGLDELGEPTPDADFFRALAKPLQMLADDDAFHLFPK